MLRTELIDALDKKYMGDTYSMGEGYQVSHGHRYLSSRMIYVSGGFRPGLEKLPCEAESELERALIDVAVSTNKERRVLNHYLHELEEVRKDGKRYAKIGKSVCSEGN